MHDAAIISKKLTVKKDGDSVLRDLDFKVHPGTITGLIGPSGSGKTTLMRAIIGVQKIDEGSLEILDKPAGDKSLRNHVGYVSQAPAVYGDLTVMQNLRYFAVLAQASKSQAEEIIAQVRLEKQRNQLVETLSGGQKARVSLAVALLGNPGVLVLDEPTVGLDPLLRQQLWQLFKDLASQGKTLLISSHVMDEADKCDRLLLLRDGQLLWQDSRLSLLETTGAKTVGEAFMTVIQNGEGS